jgi:hypothetical protein
MLISRVRPPGPVRSEHPVHHATGTARSSPSTARFVPNRFKGPPPPTARDAPEGIMPCLRHAGVAESTVTQMAGTGRRGGDEMKAVAGRSGGGTERGRCRPLTPQPLQLLDDPRPAGFSQRRLIDPAVSAGVRREHPPAVKTDPDAGLEQVPYGGGTSNPATRDHWTLRVQQQPGMGARPCPTNGSPRCRAHLDHRQRHGSHGSAGEDHGAIRSAALRPC